MYFNDFPLTSIHPWSKPAAITGKCVFRQNADTFWKFHDWIYDKQQEITLENLNSKVQEWAGQMAWTQRRWGVRGHQGY